jgi:ubiquinone/menaquinone biosynthesis C-methylase UbiE
MEQADELGRRLALGRDSTLLDVGAGRGWPGLHLGATTGCSVVLADIPLDGLIFAAERIGAERLDSRAWCVNASARALPFRARSFDAIVHTDVLC